MNPHSSRLDDPIQTPDDQTDQPSDRTNPNNHKPIWVRPTLAEQGDRQGDDRANQEHGQHIRPAMPGRCDRDHDKQRMQRPDGERSPFRCSKASARLIRPKVVTSTPSGFPREMRSKPDRPTHSETRTPRVANCKPRLMQVNGRIDRLTLEQGHKPPQRHRHHESLAA